MKYIPIAILIFILIVPAITLLSLRKEIGLKQTSSYTTSFFYSKKNFNFSFIPPKDKLNSIVLRVWNLSLEKNKPIYFNLLSDQRIIRQLIINDANIVNGDMVRFSFPEITDSKDKHFTLVLTAPETLKDDVLGIYINNLGYPVIITYHTVSSKADLICNVYKGFVAKTLSDKVFIVIWLISIGLLVYKLSPHRFQKHY